MGTQERRRSLGSVLNTPKDKDRDSTLAAPYDYAKGPASSTVSVASSADDLSRSGDGAADRRKSRQNSEDGRSDASSHRRRMSKIFKSRKKQAASLSASASRENLSLLDSDDNVPPVPELKRPNLGHPYQSDDSLGLAKSVASSLLTDDSDPEM